MAREVVIAVHRDALTAARHLSTQAAWIARDALIWLGTLDERMLSVTRRCAPDPLSIIRAHLLVGDNFWNIVRPGPLLSAAAPRPLYNLYDGDRPWIVVGETAGAELIAAPLHHARAGKMVGAMVGATNRDEGSEPGSIASRVNIGHLWTLPRSVDVLSEVGREGRARIAGVLTDYYS
jgi:hypothetical protein